MLVTLVHRWVSGATPAREGKSAHHLYTIVFLKRRRLRDYCDCHGKHSMLLELLLLPSKRKANKRSGRKEKPGRGNARILTR
jgi:hypothetical protein